MKVAYVVYPDFTALDLVGPYGVSSRWPEVEVHFVASSSDGSRSWVGVRGQSSRLVATGHARDVYALPPSHTAWFVA